MPANQSPIFPGASKLGKCALSSAVTARTVTGVTGLTKLFDAGANGTRLDRLALKATAATSNGLLFLWLYSGSGDADLWKEIPIDQTGAPSTVAASFEAEKNFDREVIPAGYSVYVSETVANALRVFAFGGDY